MKTFSSFIAEALKTRTSMQATKMGLVSDGHGGWYDKRGEYSAKTRNGKLEFSNKNQVVGRRDRNQTAQERNYSGVLPPPVKEERQTHPATLNIVFGRFNPPTKLHGDLLDVASNMVGDYIIIPSRVVDGKKNPLPVDDKVRIMRQFFPRHAEKIVNDPTIITLFDVLRKAHNEGYKRVRLFCGEDSLADYEKIANEHNYDFENIEVISSATSPGGSVLPDPDGDGVEGITSSYMRKCANQNDFKGFKKGLVPGTDTATAMTLFTDLQKAMGIAPSRGKMAETWEIAPSLDTQGMRDNYVNQRVLNMGEWVIHDSTGLKGKIVRKGTNHLICVTQQEEMFKCWIEDVSWASSSPSSPPEPLYDVDRQELLKRINKKGNRLLTRNSLDFRYDGISDY